MRHRGQGARQADSGFSLIEMMITLTVMAIVLGVVFNVLHRSQRQTQRMTNVAEERQMARTAVQLIEREARMAGSGWGRTLVNGNSFTLNAINPGPGSTGRSDSLVLVGAWQANTTINSSMPSSSAVFKVNSVTGFNVGDLVIVTDKDNKTADLFQITATNSASMQIQHNPSSAWNDAGGRNGFPAGGYPAGSYLYKITMATYYFDSTTFRKPALIRREVGGTPQIVAYNVDGFHVWYAMQDGTWTRNPASLSQVDQVIPVVLTKVTDPRQATLRDSVWAMARPRTF